MRLMMVTPSREASAVGGREQLSALHQSCLADLLGGRLTVRRLEAAPTQGAFGVLDALRGRIDGVSAGSERALIDEIAAGGVDTLWLDGTNLGRLGAVVKRAAPAVRVLSFAHNVEARFFLGALRHRPGPRALAVLAANLAAERMAVRSSDRLVALSERDSALLGRLYRRGASDILPMAIDASGATPAVAAEPGSGLLFVGGAFYANLAGVRWFSRHVAPRLAVTTRIVGRGFDAYRAELEAGGRIEVVGTADDLAPHYAAAAAVIAPIFDGSGMKTKVAEALMYGKSVIGTREAFSGYEEVAGEAGWRAYTAEEWIGAIGELGASARPGFDPALRRLFDRLYSRAALSAGIAAILGLDA